jgi:RNA polymerase primary sigma factor
MDASLVSGMASFSYANAKNNLMAVVREFPFSFEDLGKIVEVLVCAYKLRECPVQTKQEESENSHDLLVKRLQMNKRRNRAPVTKMDELLKEFDVYDYDENFLFMSVVEMRSYLTDLVTTEQCWLAARRQLAEANNKLVLFIANQYKAGFMDFEDLVQEGQTGLLKAVDRFDYRLGFQFSTYAGYWIRQAISRSLSRSERLVRIPCGQVANINKVFRAKNELMAKTGLEPSVNELSEYTKISNDDINMILSISQSVMSLEGPEDEEDSFAPIDFLEQNIFTPAFTSIAEEDLDRLLDKAIGSLTPREAKVICSHFGVDSAKEMTLQEIGFELNLTRERVRQIQVMALNKIKLNFGQQLMCFL